MRDFEGQTYNTFQEFFARKRKGCPMDSEFKRGQEMGHFELAGSTIVMLFQKDRIRLREQMETGEEVGVRMGEMIGYTEVREIG